MFRGELFYIDLLGFVCIFATSHHFGDTRDTFNTLPYSEILKKRENLKDVAIDGKIIL
jgi:hypothetical protein